MRAHNGRNVTNYGNSRRRPAPYGMMMADTGRLSRRAFLGASAAAVTALAARPQEAEPVIDIHQHTDYGGARDKTGKVVRPGRTDDQLLAHQKAMGVSRTVLLP